MIQALMIMIAVSILELAIIIFLISRLAKKREKMIIESNKAEVEKEIIINKIKSKTDEQIKELDDEAKKAKDFNDVKHIIIDKLFD